MVEEESPQIASEPAGAAPVNRDKRGDAGRDRRRSRLAA